MKKFVIISLAALATVSGATLAGAREKSDSEAPIMGSKAVLVEQAPLSAPDYSFIWDGAERRGGSNDSR